ncbi:bifunctional riboflavin kinase/FAD synthetase [Egicoccus halophilus]|uniref:Riboflavin biosynthesis protein n=1 Tax=Egicoccus halophilus TaxID=1670830 RepID=A0A8J3A8F2_9ACTN|nr:bifunctional riboflavin kinase/FAD synthetase [Egicoccus halophilus]GGI06536.1 riboflavin biosynthesis protein [Egicoccus halophilus]
MSEVHRADVHELGELTAVDSVVTIGNFDGVHRGHQVLLRRTVDAARDRDARAVAITFDPHPAAVLRPGSEPPRLQSVDERVAALCALDLDLVVVLAFTRELSHLSPQAFVEDVLVRPLGTRRLIVGTNFRFGHKAAGDVVTLVEAGDVHGFEVEAVTLRELEHRPISSTQVRRSLADGDLGWANLALGRPYAVRGEVVPGDGRGRTIGVPTANVAVDDGRLVPANGVYAGTASVEGSSWPAVTNVGRRPTFAGATRTVEVHLLDADPDLYGRELTFAFEHRLRDEQRFDGVEALVAQIHTDIATARELLG